MQKLSAGEKLSVVRNVTRQAMMCLILVYCVRTRLCIM